MAGIETLEWPAPGSTFLDAPEIRMHTMEMGFEAWLTSDPNDPRTIDENYRNAVLAMRGVAELTGRYPSPQAQNETFDIGIRAACERLDRPSPVELPRIWKMIEWEGEYRSILIALEPTPKCPNLSGVQADNFQLFWAIKDGLLRHKPTRGLLI